MRILVKITNQNTRGQMLHPQTLTANLKGIITDIRVNERNRKLSFAQEMLVIYTVIIFPFIANFSILQ